VHSTGKMTKKPTSGLEKKVWDQVFAPGTPFEVREEVISYEGESAHFKGVKYEVFPNGPQTLLDIYKVPVANGAMKLDFLVDETSRLTFQETYNLSAALGSALVKDFGLQKGDRVITLSKNRNEYLVALIGSTSVGGVSVPMNSYWKTKELEYGVENSGAKVIVCDADRYKSLEPILDKLTSLKHVLLLSGPGADKFKPHPKVVFFDDAVRKHQGAAMPVVSVGKDDNAMIMYTSGTTGHPKGVVLTHRSIAHNLTAAASAMAYEKNLAAAKTGKALDPPLDPSKTAFLLAVPLFHVTGHHCVCLLSILSCRKIVIMSKWDPEHALQLIETEKCTNFTGVPTMVLDMMSHPNFKKYDTSTLVSVGGGGAAPPSTMVGEVDRNFKGASPLQAWGMTETNGIATLNEGDLYRRKPSSCGKAVPTTEIAIWDANDKPVPTNEEGELVIRGALMLKEYWNNLEATAKNITADGWFRTGDVGVIDEEGYLHLRGRSKEIIIRGGENISCVVVENAVYQHPEIAEVAAIPVPHPTLGEEVGIAVFTKGNARPSLESIRKICGDLARYEMPTHLYIWPEQLPRGDTGKIHKRTILADIKDGKIRDEAVPVSKL